MKKILLFIIVFICITYSQIPLSRGSYEITDGSLTVSDSISSSFAEFDSSTAVKYWQALLSGDTTAVIDSMFYIGKVWYNNKSSETDSLGLSSSAGNEVFADSIAITAGSMGFITIKSQKEDDSVQDTIFIEVADDSLRVSIEFRRIRKPE